jgi:hypothetical protein
MCREERLRGFGEKIIAILTNIMKRVLNYIDRVLSLGLKKSQTNVFGVQGSTDEAQVRRG